MRLILISQDYQLFQMCRRIVEVAAPPPSEVLVIREDEDMDGDVCIWDYLGGESTPRAFARSSGTRVLIASRKELAAFPADLGDGAHLVLRPATDATLSAFITTVRSIPSAQARVASLTSERDALLELLLQSNLKLQEYDQARTTFLARAAHDTRTPLTALKGYCSLLLQGQIGPLSASQMDVLSRMQSSIGRLSRLCSAMFDLNIDSWVEAAPRLEVNPIDPSVQEAVRQIGPIAGEKDISITVQLDPFSEPVAFEPFRIEQVLINLLENSCKFTPRSGAVEVRGYRYFWDRRKPLGGGFTSIEDRRRVQTTEPNSYRIDVCDTGPGVPPQHVKEIFEEFTSYGGSEDRSCGGLGLAICKMIMNQHHGRIWVENSRCGAVFSVVLPFQKRNAPTAGSGSVAAAS